MAGTQDAGEKKYFNVGVLVFPGGDILDFTGPMEILSHVSHNMNPDAPDRVYSIKTIGREDVVLTASSFAVKPDRLIETMLPEDSSPVETSNLNDLDILIVPGGPPSVMMPLLGPDSPEIRLLTAFASLPAKANGSGPRHLLSVCTGAFLLGKIGLLAGIPCTTHHRALEPLGRICGSAQPTEILERRYVDGGFCKSPIAQESALRVVTSGGISSGLDMTLWVVAQQIGIDTAKFIARVMEYDVDWQKDAAREERNVVVPRTGEVAA